MGMRGFTGAIVTGAPINLAEERITESGKGEVKTMVAHCRAATVERTKAESGGGVGRMNDLEGNMIEIRGIEDVVGLTQEPGAQLRNGRGMRDTPGRAGGDIPACLQPRIALPQRIEKNLPSPQPQPSLQSENVQPHHTSQTPTL